MRSDAQKLAPWVLQNRRGGSIIFAGGRLSLVRAHHETILRSLEPQLRHDFFLQLESRLRDDPSTSGTGSSSPEPEVLIFDGTQSPWLAPSIMACLGKEGIGSSMWAPDSPPAPVVMLHHHEARTWTTTHQTITARHPMIWLFESPTGRYLGPVIRDRSDWQDFIGDTEAFCDESTLDRVFPEWRPCAIGAEREDAGRIAAAIKSALTNLESGTVWPLEQVATPRVLPKSAQQSALPWEKCGLLEWDFGLFRNRTSSVISTPIGDVFIESCRSPAGRINSTLESNSGKGWTRAQAETTMRGEAVERASAFWGNSLEIFPPGLDDVPLSSLAPFGPLWDERRDREDQDERAIGVDLSTGDPTTVPIVAVAFPYVPRDRRTRPTSGDTTGLAAYPTRTGAVLRGLREVLERDSLYTNLMHLKSGVRQPVEQVGPLQIWRYWFDDMPFPAVHTVVVVEGAARIIGRGTGSALSWSAARESSLLEAVQIFEQMRRGAPRHGGDAYDSWSTPQVQAEVLSYLEGMPIGGPNPSLEAADDNVQLAKILDCLDERGGRAIAVDLPTPLSDVVAVRVLVPGAVTNPHTRASLAGNKLEGGSWKFGIPV